MTQLIQVKVPDIGDADGAEVIEVLVAVGEQVEQESPLIVLETDKATMEVPSSDAGVVEQLSIKVGDKVCKDDIILQLQVGEMIEHSAEKAVATDQTVNISRNNNDIEANKDQPTVAPLDNALKLKSEKNGVIDIIVPDIGDANDVDVIEVLIKENDTIEKEQALIVLETDKATMEVPSTSVGTVKRVLVKVGDKVSQGDLIGQLQRVSREPVKQKNSQSGSNAATSLAAAPISSTTAISVKRDAPVPDHPYMKKKQSARVIHSSPSVRRFARELGADLSKVKGSGNKNRIIKDDVQNYIKFELSRPKATATSDGFATLKMPSIDHAKWGEVENQPLTRIQKISSVNLHRNWISIPHVTQHEEADITELDSFRKNLKQEALQAGTRLTPLAFILKALVYSLKAFPKFNASLANDGENLILKHYYHIGVAVETPEGLTVPVIRDVDQKGVYRLADELAEISAKAREKKLGANDMQGSSFTISSLGGIGGTAFSPIVKWPDVAILGLSRNKMQPVWDGKEFQPRLMLPISLSYDHRVIDGADAARFVVHLASALKDIRRVLLN